MTKLYAIFIALLPLISLYKAPFIGVNLSVLFLLLFSCYHFFLLLIRKKPSDSAVRSGLGIWPPLLIIYICSFGFMMREDSFLSRTYDIATFLVLLIPPLLGAVRGNVDLPQIRKTVCTVSVIAVVLLVFQYFMYYVFHTTLSSGRVVFLPFTSSLEDAYYAGKSMFGENGLFRPSAFFLEPSHLAQYVSVALISVLFSENVDRRKIWLAICYSIGNVLSTSGAGILMTAGIWGCFSFLKSGKSLGRKIAASLVLILGIGAVFLILNRFDFFQQALNRFTSDGSEIENAYTGRLYTSYFLENRSSITRMLGAGFRNIPVYTGVYNHGMEYYMVGIVESLYCLGIIGTVILIGTLASTIWRSKGFSRVVALMYFALFFAAARLKTVDVAFYMTFILVGYTHPMPITKPYETSKYLK